MALGLGFAPALDDADSLSMGSRRPAPVPVQRAIQILSLRLPEAISGRSMAPPALLTAGPSPRASAVVESLLKQVLGPERAPVGMRAIGAVNAPPVSARTSGGGAASPMGSPAPRQGPAPGATEPLDLLEFVRRFFPVPPAPEPPAIRPPQVSFLQGGPPSISPIAPTPQAPEAWSPPGLLPWISAGNRGVAPVSPAPPPDEIGPPDLEPPIEGPEIGGGGFAEMMRRVAGGRAI